MVLASDHLHTKPIAPEPLLERVQSATKSRKPATQGEEEAESGARAAHLVHDHRALQAAVRPRPALLAAIELGEGLLGRRIAVHAQDDVGVLRAGSCPRALGPWSSPVC